MKLLASWCACGVLLQIGFVRLAFIERGKKTQIPIKWKETNSYGASMAIKKGQENVDITFSVVFSLSEFKEIVELLFWRDFSSFFSRKSRILNRSRGGRDRTLSIFFRLCSLLAPLLPAI
jgi:hypothetical protein